MYTPAQLLHWLASLATSAAFTRAREATGRFRAHIDAARAEADLYAKDAALGRKIRLAFSAAQQHNRRAWEEQSARRTELHRVWLGDGLGHQDLPLSDGATNVGKGGAA